MYHILIPIRKVEAHTQQVVDAVCDLPLQANSAKVSLLYTFEELDSDPGGTISLEEYDDVPENVAEITDAFEDEGFEVQLATVEGDHAEAIISFTRDRDVDQIYLLGRDRSPTGKAIFGSTVQSVILDTDVPVTVVPE